MATLRCFVGIAMPECIAEPLVQACHRLREADPSWRDEKWVARENLHMTLHFLGGVEEAVLPDLRDALSDTVQAHEAFSLPFAGIVAVPGTRRCRMLWASFLDPEGTCSRLAESVQRTALRFGVPLEDRTFKPHVTLVRARRPKPLAPAALAAAQEAAADVPRSMSVGGATLYESRLTPRGPRYAALGDWHARGSDDHR